jgi:hypothetical protein
MLAMLMNPRGAIKPCAHAIKKSYVTFVADRTSILIR